MKKVCIAIIINIAKYRHFYDFLDFLQRLIDQINLTESKNMFSPTIDLFRLLTRSFLNFQNI